jgi:hypothetical protein
MAELKRAQDQPRAEDFVGDMGNSRDRLTPEEPMVCDDSQTAGADRPRLAQNETSQRQIQGQILDGEYVRASGVAPSPLTTPDNRVRDAAGSATSLLSESEIGDLRSRWNNIQAEFVDEPRRAVEQADKLVATAIKRLADGFANERASLENQWESGNDASTEDLRLALQRYRAFFGRLLNAA